MPKAQTPAAFASSPGTAHACTSSCPIPTSIFNGAGRFPHRDQPDRFIEVVNEFLAREWRLQARRPAGAAVVKRRRSKSA